MLLNCYWFIVFLYTGHLSNVIEVIPGHFVAKISDFLKNQDFQSLKHLNVQKSNFLNIFFSKLWKILNNNKS